MLSVGIPGNTVESQIFRISKGNENWLENQITWVTGGKITVFDWGGGFHFNAETNQT